MATEHNFELIEETYFGDTPRPPYLTETRGGRSLPVRTPEQERKLASLQGKWEREFERTGRQRLETLPELPLDDFPQTRGGGSIPQLTPAQTRKLAELESEYERRHQEQPPSE